MYLACWGSTLPDGGRMTVTFAAEHAGITPEAVRSLRMRNPAFERLEFLARHGKAAWAQSYVEAGLRGLSPWLMDSLARLVKEGNPQVVLKLTEWLRGRPEQLQISGSKEEPLQVFFGWDPDDDDDDPAPEAP